MQALRRCLPIFLALAVYVSSLPVPGKGFFERECQGNSTCEAVFAKDAVSLLQRWSAESSPYVDPYVAKEELESSSFLLVPSLLEAAATLITPFNPCPPCSPTNPQACLACVSQQYAGSVPHGLFLVVSDEDASKAIHVAAAQREGQDPDGWLKASSKAQQALGEKLISTVRSGIFLCIYIYIQCQNVFVRAFFLPILLRLLLLIMKRYHQN
jgi:hypothetical protein